MRMLLSFLVCHVLAVSAQFDYDARIEDDLGVHHVCDGVVVPVPKIRNAGMQVMTGCVVETWKNSILVGTFDWQLEIAALSGQVRQPVLPEVNEVEPGDVVELRIISVNGFPDEVAEGNTRSIVIEPHPLQAQTYLMEVRCMTTGSAELDWVLRDRYGNAVMSEEALVLVAGEEHVAWVEVQPAACYSIFAKRQPAGSGELVLAIRSGGYDVLGLAFTDQDEEQRAGFISGTVTGVASAPSAVPVFLSWNGDAEVLRVRTSSTTSGVLHVAEASGRTVQRISMTAQPEGAIIPIAHLSAGCYIAQYTSTEGVSGVLRFVQSR